MEDRLRKPYRPCVVGVFVNEKKEVLVALRRDKRAWQFPQGGVEDGESFKEALFREMKEEIGCDRFEIVTVAPEMLHYDFPEKSTIELAKVFRGQSQRWFLCKFHEGFGPNLDQCTSDEFLETKWSSPQEIAKTIIDWKKETYRRGLGLLGLL